MPTVYALFPDIKPAWLDSSADPLSGGKLFIYTAGSSAKATTYTTSAGDVANTNPIVLDSRGEVPHGVYTPTGTYKAVLAPSSDTDPPASAIWTRDNLTAPNDTAAATQSEWVTGPTPTYASGTSFTLEGDQTTDFHVGRRLQMVDSGGTSYGTISVTAYSDPNTTVTVVNDATVLDSGLSAVSYSLLSATNPSTPWLSSTASAGQHLVSDGTKYEPKSGGWEYVDSYEPSADASFEIFHDGLDTSGSADLIDGWEYCLDIEGYAGDIPSAGTVSSFMIQTYEDSSWITTSGDYHYSLMTAPLDTGGNVLSSRNIYAGMFVVSFGDAATDFTKTSVHITNAANSSRATNCLFHSTTDTSNTQGYNYDGNSHRWNTNWTDAATKMRLIASDGVSTVTGRVLLFRRYVG